MDVTTLSPGHCRMCCSLQGVQAACLRGVSSTSALAGLLPRVGRAPWAVPAFGLLSIIF